jgi:Tol biopolymer transport system component/DNA-binding winged helix-turn-helix (wHTH) protein
MPVIVSAETPFTLLDIQVIPLTLTLSQGSLTLQIQQKPMEVLCYLVQCYPALVTREQLISAVWDGNFYVGEKALTNTIWQLRQSFSQFGQPDLISTVRKKGYRLQQPPQHNSGPAADLLSSPVVADDATVSPTTRRYALLLRAGIWLLPLIVLGVALLWFGWHGTSPSLQKVSQRPGWSMYPTVTPDGRYLAYSWQLFGQPADLFLQDLRQPELPARQLTFSPEDELRAEISTDGQTLYYSARDPMTGSCEIRQLQVKTLEEQKLWSCGRHSDVYLDLSPDGRFLYFNGSRDQAGRSLYRLDLQQLNAIPEAMPCRDHCAQRVRDIAVAPDGRHIALTRRANRLSEEVYLYDMQNAEEQQLTFGQSDIRGLTWSGDSRKVIYSSESHSRSQGYVLDIVSRQQTPIPVDDVSFVSRVTQQQQLYFHRDSSIPQLGYLPVKTSSAVFPLSAGDLTFQSPDFHPTRAELLYLSNESGSSELWLSDRQLLQKRQLTRLGGVIKYPRWSNSGKKILFVSRSAASTDDRLTILDVATGKLSFPETGMRIHGRPTWTADDQAVLLAVDGKLNRFDLQSGQLQRWTEGSGSYAQMPDQRGFYYSKGRGRGLWWQALVQGQPSGKPEQIISADLFSETYSWLATADAIYYLQTVRDSVAVRVMQLSDRSHRTLVILPTGQIDLAANLTFDPEKQQLLMQYSPIPRIDIWRWQLP